MKKPHLSLVLLAAATLPLVGIPAARAASVPEPETVFYGRIINRMSGQTCLLSDGSLTWRIRRSNGTLLTLTTQLQPLYNGFYSYRLNVPHQALSLGLPVTASAVPLSAQPTTCFHDGIAVDGYPATILPPGSSSFAISQSTRAAAYRLDLEVTNPLPDLDEDGLPDWWANLYLILDPRGDPDGDGRDNLSEFKDGSDPNHDDRVPTLATTELRAYADGTTALLLRSIDSDSAPANLVYTVAAVPESTRLLLRNTATGGANRDSALSHGATFTQADVNAGRLILTHQGESIAPGNLQFVLADESAAHARFTGSVAVAFYRPATPPISLAVSTPLTTTPPRFPVLAGLSAGEEPMATGYILSKEMGFVVSDASGEAMGRSLATPSSGLNAAAYQAQYVPGYGPDRRHLLLGGVGSDTISGSMEGDILIGGRGKDTLRGNGGADLFVLNETTDGNDTIADFNPGEGDVIDVSRLLIGTSLWLTNYIQLVSSGTNSELRINFSGMGGAYADLNLALAGVPMTQAEFFQWTESGHIYTGGKILPPRVTVLARQPNASENGPVPGEFILSRSGSVEAALTVELQLTGSAANGNDYAYVNRQATFLPGNRTLTIQINPFVDALTELTEVVDLAVLPGIGYESGDQNSARVTIEDLAPQISIETIESTAVKSGLVPGVILVSRAGVLDRSVLVRLNISGTASATDYQGVPTFINFQAGEATALIYVTPRTAAVIQGGSEFVQVSISPDATYKVTAASQARVILIDEMLTFPAWRERYFAGVPGDLASFAVADLGLTGVRHFQRYAFGLDPAVPQTSPGRPYFQKRDGHLTVEFRRPVSVTDVQYAIEVSEDLVTWQAGDQYVEPYTSPAMASQPETAAYRVKSPMTETRTMFMRVRPVYVP